MNWMSCAAMALALLSGIISVNALAERLEQLPIWPLPSRTDFSSGFGDFRPGRFHYGIDLRTGDKPLAVVAPVSGYISQARVSYFGYGKGLYLHGDNGYTYVFAHLDRFAGGIDQFIKKRQRKEQRYFVREWFESDKFVVKQGDTIAFSGKTGIGAAHLHFEVRDTSNVPRSPLGQGLWIKDTDGPEILSVTFEYVDSRSVFASGRRRRTIQTEFAGVGPDGVRRYTLKSQPYLSAEFGLIVSARDFPTNRTFDSSPHSLRFFVSSPVDPKSNNAQSNNDKPEYRLLYELTLDSLSYSEGSLASCVYEQGMAHMGDKNAYLLFQRDSNDGCFDSRQWLRAGRFPDFVSGGRSGVFPARVEVSDASGNLSTLDFNFAYGPGRPLFRLIDIGSTSALVAPIGEKLLSDTLDLAALQVARLKTGGGWALYKEAAVKGLKAGAYRITIDDMNSVSRRGLFRLALKGNDGWSRRDLIFSSAPMSDKIKVMLSYEPADGGLYVIAETSAPTTRSPELRALTAGGRSLELRPVQIGAQKFIAYLPPDTLLAKIVRLEAYRRENEEQAVRFIENLHLAALGGDSGLVYREHVTDRGTFYAPLGGLERPRILEFGKADGPMPQPRAIAAGPFVVGPLDFRYDYPVRVGIRPKAALDPALNVAICKLSKKKDKWDWFDTQFEEGVFWAETSENGVYALMIDSIAPKISRLRPGGPGGKTRLQSRRPQVTAKIEDALSGIWVDTLFDVRIDGEWLIPEYDAEDFTFRARPAADLAPGTHELVFTVRDNAGNQRQRRETFIVE